jgi:CO/xanthine dehydrogenase Mo-binding subunit
MGGGAVVNAAKIIKQRLCEGAEKALGISGCSYKNGNIYSAQGEIVADFFAAVRWCYDHQIYPYAFGVFKAPQISWDEETGHGNAYFSWVYSCQAAELKVNCKTGKITLLNLVAAHDIGKAINPALLTGQIYGGMAMGAGYALYENFPLVKGEPQITNYNGYRVMRSTDLPEMTAILIENADPNSPSNAKGIGEPALEITAPAIANALYRATGKRFTDLPIAPQVREYVKGKKQ